MAFVNDTKENNKIAIFYDLIYSLLTYINIDFVY